MNKITVKAHKRSSKTGKIINVRKYQRKSKDTFFGNFNKPYEMDFRKWHPIHYYNYSQMKTLTFEQWGRDMGGIENFFISDYGGKENWDGRILEKGMSEREDFIFQVNQQKPRFQRIMTTLLSLKFPLTVYRVLALKNIDALSIQYLGIHWSYDSRWLTWTIGRVTEQNRFVLVTKVNFNTVDWGHTLWMHMNEGFSDEFEVTLLKRTKVRNIKVYRKGRIIKIISGTI